MSEIGIVVDQMVAWAQKAAAAPYRTSVEITARGVQIQGNVRGRYMAFEVPFQEIRFAVVDPVPLAIDHVNAMLREQQREAGKHG